MSIGVLRVAALVAYLISWAVFAVTAVLGMFARGQRTAQKAIVMSVVAGTFLQWAAFASIMMTLPAGPLRPGLVESTGGLALAPAAAALFIWAQHFSAPRGTSETLVTSGAYRWLRHPIYLAFLLMLLATALVASTGLKALAAVVLFVTGSEIRIAVEETELRSKFPGEFAAYRKRTNWRYLPGLR